MSLSATPDQATSTSSFVMLALSGLSALCPGSTNLGPISYPRAALPSGRAPVAQWIEQRFPKPRALVRFRPGA